MFRLSTISLSVAAVLAAGAAQASSAVVTVPASATGGFGKPNTGYTQLVKALTVARAGLLTITVKSGSFCYQTACPGPWGHRDGGLAGSWFPLQEGSGGGGVSNDALALIGAFVPQGWASKTGFAPIDQKIATTTPGIGADKLFLVGRTNFYFAPGPGTLYLGNNDYNPGNDTGSIVVSVTGP